MCDLQNSVLILDRIGPISNTLSLLSMLLSAASFIQTGKLIYCQCLSAETKFLSQMPDCAGSPLIFRCRAMYFFKLVERLN